MPQRATVSGTPPPRSPRYGRGLLIGSVGSIALHLGFVLWLGIYATAPDLGFHFMLPAEVEFGLTKGVTVEGGSTGGASTPPTPPKTAATHGPGTTAAVDAGVPADAAVDAAHRHHPRHPTRHHPHHPRDAGVDAGPENRHGGTRAGSPRRRAVGDHVRRGAHHRAARGRPESPCGSTSPGSAARAWHPTCAPCSRRSRTGGRSWMARASTPSTISIA